MGGREVKKAMNIATLRAVRTFAQTMAGGLGAVSLAALTATDARLAGQTALLGLFSAIVAAAIAFFTNLAENLEDE